MADTYTDSGMILPELSASDVWGDRVNDGVTDIASAMIGGKKTIAIGSSTTYTLAAQVNGVLGDSHYYSLTITGTPASAVTFLIPASVVRRNYQIKNSTGQTVTVKYAASTGVVLGNGDTTIVWCDGSEVYDRGPGYRITPAEIAAGVTPSDFSYKPGRPERMGGDPTGVADSAQAWIDTLLSNKYLDATGASWLLQSTVTIPAGRAIDYRGATITADTGATPIFEFEEAGEGLSIIGYGVPITGTADSFLKLIGSTYTPTQPSHYARQIRLNGVHVSSTTIDKFIDMQKAVRQVWTYGCYGFTVNGINTDGKCVEIYNNGLNLYSSTGAAGTYGVILYSSGGTSYYNEGWHFTDCLVDNFEKSFYPLDIFVLTVNGGYVGAASGGYALDVGAPTTTHCRQIEFKPSVVAGKIRFTPSGGYSYNSSIDGVRMTGVSGTHIQLANNAAGISIIDLNGDTSTSGVLVEMVDNNANCSVTNWKCDSTFAGGVQVKGTAGENCTVTDCIGYDGTGNAVYIERPVLLKGIPIQNSTVWGYKTSVNTTDLRDTSVAVSDVICTLANVKFSKGETGKIQVVLNNCTGMDASLQYLTVAVPSGVVLTSGTAWQAGYIYPGETNGRVFAEIPYYVDAEVTGDVTLTNTAGNTMAIGYHSYMAVVKDW